VGEQTGPVEDELKASLTKALKDAASVRAAYLARVSYGEPSDNSVALCICSTTGADDRLRERLASIFAGIFRSDAYLDIIFIREDQQQRLALVCSPFYDVA